MDLYVNKGSVRTLINSYITSLTTPKSYAVNDALKQLKNKVDLMPTITKSELFDVAQLEWWEEWSESTSDSPRECLGAGWGCSYCGVDLGEYQSQAIGEICYLDNPEKKPKLRYCPSCGKKFV